MRTKIVKMRTKIVKMMWKIMVSFKGRKMIWMGDTERWKRIGEDRGDDG